ncbi:putative membrane protein [Trichinella spiralis]|uniref:hypothetical protein n=1 Tax=Trichinella spiralis TaxID=6334 RepID=UPI0001EFB3F5|nr:putative membrane protein [Trichinella spiralis]
MKFDGFRHPREQVAPITLAGTFRNQPLRLLFYRNPFLGLFFTIGFILLPYVGHQFCSRKKGFDAPAGRALERLFAEVCKITNARRVDETAIPANTAMQENNRFAYNYGEGRRK